MNRLLYPTAFAVGLGIVAWLAAGYVGTHPLALATTVVIAAAYLFAAWELQRFQQATRSLHAALEAPPAAGGLDDWLNRVHPGLREAVRLRIEDARVALPGPALTPYLVGLLVLLGMLGTFLGMVVTLKGTSLALESATDVQAIRASLAAPVKGLGLAFGTSVAGVAASAMLGLMSALARRDRVQAGQRLDAQLASGLRPFGRAHQREQSFQLLQRQADTLPLLVDRLQQMMETLERQQQALGERLASGQDRFHEQAQARYTGLAESVDRSLRASLSESARLAGATLQPVVQATMAGIAQETQALQAALREVVQQQLDGVAQRVAAGSEQLAQQWHAAMAQQQQSQAALLARLQQQAEAMGQRLDDRTETLLQRLTQAQAAAQTEMAATSTQMAQQAAAAVQTAARAFEQQATQLVQQLQQSQADAQAGLATGEHQRLQAWTHALQTTAATLQQQWQQAGAETLAQQQQICETLARTADQIGAQAEAHARNTIAEITQLVQVASEAPRAAAEVIGELRQRLSDSMARDNAVLEERSRILQTLSGLLDALNHASAEQRGAIDTLVSSSAALLHDTGERFAQQVQAEGDKLAAAAAQISGSAVEVASLGEAFGHATELFTQANDKLVAQLQRIEAALGQQIARSDDQLAYYVAQARELIDLSLMSQKQIVDDLQRLAPQRSAALDEA